MSVGEVISRAWAFAGRKLVPLLGLGWLTAAFYGGIVAYLLDRLSAAMLAGPRPDAGSFNNFALFYLFCLVVVTAFANAVMGLPMSREALEPGGEWKTAYFSVARREWGLFANLLLLYVLLIGLIAAIIFAGGVGIAVSLPMVGNHGVWQGIALDPVMRGVVALFAVCAGLFLAARFGFFLAPISAADPPARLLQAWVLSRGKFWRLLIVSLALLIPVAVLSLLADWAVLGTTFGSALAATPRDMTSLFHLIRGNTSAIAAVSAISLFVWNAVFAGASADAYAYATHGVESPSPGDFVSIAEPALARAAFPAAAADDAPRTEPAFSAVTESATVATGPETISEQAKPVEPMAEHKAEEKSEEPNHKVEAQAAGPDHLAEEIEFKTVEDLPSPMAVSSVVAKAEPENPEMSASVEAHEEPLAPHEPLPAIDPLDHAAPAEPDPAAASATPLPSFVQVQSSPEHDSSEAA